MSSFVLSFQDIDTTNGPLVGGKGAHLAELSKMEGIRVPDGFCISTEAFKRIVGGSSAINELLDELSRLTSKDPVHLGALSSEIRRAIEGLAVPDDIDHDISRFLSRLGADDAYAVRSSATAEDSPTASFAGQHDTYLNVIGRQAILEHIAMCWASLFTDRAVVYRLQHGVDHRTVLLSVVVQRMVFPRAAGVLFTADPVTSHRKVLSIEAGFGLSQAFVSGLVNADIYRVMGGKVIAKTIAIKKVALSAVDGGGTEAQGVGPEQQNAQVLTDDEIVHLERIGREIEQHFGCPQDIEWCLVDDAFSVVQSRPITTLYPIPEARDDANHVYISVGHQQMMTDPIKPLGLSFFLLTTHAPMRTAGGRLFVDITQHLASPAGRRSIIEVLGQSDPLIRDALMTIVARDGFIESSRDVEDVPRQSNHTTGMSWKHLARLENNPTLVPDLIESWQTSLEELQQTIQLKSGAALLDFIRDDISQLQKILFSPQSSDVIRVAMYASSWLNTNMMKWLGEKNAADTLSQSVPNNITSEMGLELLDVADVIRPHPDVVDYLHHVGGEDFVEQLGSLAGGREARDALRAYLARYGMRCAGEMDITRTRWSEKPTTLVPMILSNIKNCEPNASRRKVEQGQREAARKEHELVGRLQQLPGGARKARETRRMISLMRSLAGYREYPKYGMINRYFVYKQALLKEAERLVQANVIRRKEDIYHLTFDELRDVVLTRSLDDQIISRRKDEYRGYEQLTPPRVLTSDGEIIAGEYRRENLPSEALAGLPVSSGLIEGRARVIVRMEDADLEEGDILVTAYTDPSWTPLFVSIRGLVTEVGGLMTHGAVIAREYGVPAVVGVENATKLIRDGQRIRVHGTEGYVEVLSGD